MKKEEQGFTLIELLTALVLLSLAAAGLGTGFIQCLRAQKKIEQNHKIYDPLRVFYYRFEKDLRNAVVLNEYPFKGSVHAITFPEAEDIQGQRRLFLIEYQLEDGRIRRSRQSLDSALVKEKAQEKTLILGATQAEFVFSFLDEEKKSCFRNFWPENPYFGIPRAVRLDFEWTGANGASEKMTKSVSIPQGHWAFLEGQQ